MHTHTHKHTDTQTHTHISIIYPSQHRQHACQFFASETLCRVSANGANCVPKTTEFQSGHARVVNKVLHLWCYVYLWHTMHYRLRPIEKCHYRFLNFGWNKMDALWNQSFPKRSRKNIGCYEKPTSKIPPPLTHCEQWEIESQGNHPLKDDRMCLKHTVLHLYLLVIFFWCSLTFSLFTLWEPRAGNFWEAWARILKSRHSTLFHPQRAVQETSTVKVFLFPSSALAPKRVKMMSPSDRIIMIITITMIMVGWLLLDLF